MKKIVSYTDLIVWQQGHKLVLEIYKVTNSFPKREDYVLTAQMRRAAISVTSNIAEGFTRKSKKEKIQFYFISKASLIELHNQLFVARDVQYLTKVQSDLITEQIFSVGRLLTRFISTAEDLQS